MARSLRCGFVAACAWRWLSPFYGALFPLFAVACYLRRGCVGCEKLRVGFLRVWRRASSGEYSFECFYGVRSGC